MVKLEEVVEGIFSFPDCKEFYDEIAAIAVHPWYVERINAKRKKSKIGKFPAN